MTQAYTAYFPFGGAGGGALGFSQAEVRLLGREARFDVLGGFDIDPEGCKDFEYLSGVPQACADVAALSPADVRRIAGPTAPDVIFMSPPCKGASGLLSETLSSSPKYQAMNGLALTWTRLMLAAWAEPPRLVLLENVPRLKKRAAPMLRKIRRLLNAAGYVCSDGFHDCGELGGLAQHRRRYLLVARHRRRVPPLLYQPPVRKVRACGEVLGPLPMPEDPAGGPMHRLPRISWLNWVRLALIPAGGDWRDLDGVLAEGESRREKFKRHAVEDWAEPVGTVGGSGSNGVENVADPRVSNAFDNGYRVLGWDEPSPTVAGKSHPGNGAYAVADPRLGCEPRAGAYGVLSWQEAAATVTGSAGHDNGPWSVADPRKPPPQVPVIVAADGTWHRPLTTLELAILQGFPALVQGAPLKLAGSASSAWRERIGNAVPPPAAKAIAEQMLVALLQADHEAFALSGDSAVWVEPEALAAGAGP